MEEEEKKKNLLGVGKKSSKRCKKKKLLSKVIDYLKSDDYMFAPILSAPAPTSASGQLLPKQQAFSRVVEIQEPGKEGEGKKKKRMIDEVWSYLLSDSYMYAPCTDGDSGGRRDAKISDSGRSDGGEKLLRSDDRRSELTESAAGMGKRASEEGRVKGTAAKRARVVEQHHQIQTVKKYMVYQSCQS